MLLDMGKDFCRTLAVYSEHDNSYYKTILQECQYNWDFNNQTEIEPEKPKALKAPKIGRSIKTLGSKKDNDKDHLKGILSVTTKNK